MHQFLLATFGVVCLGGCGEPLPDEAKGAAERCIQMNREPLHATPDDPHEGIKNVYACGISQEDLAARKVGEPYPDGTLIVKESSREDQDYVWLVATMKKVDGAWEWREYTRNFASEDFLRLGVPEQTCIDCHTKVAGNDFLYQVYIP